MTFTQHFYKCDFLFVMILPLSQRHQHLMHVI